MTSVCPHCKTEVEHEDYLFEVQCTKCKSRFNPYFDASESNASEESAGAPSAPEAEANPAVEPPAAAEAIDFSESNQTFAEIRDFGEGISQVTEEAKATQKAAAPTPPPSAPPRRAASVSVSDSDFFCTPGDSFPGISVTKYLAPVSLWCQLTEGEEEPLKAGLDRLATICQERGAAAAIGLRWSFSPDGSRVLLVATPAIIA